MNRYATEPAPHDAALRAAIAAAADTLSFDAPPDSPERQRTLGRFVAALADRLALGFPQSAAAARARPFTGHDGPSRTARITATRTAAMTKIWPRSTN